MGRSTRNKGMALRRRRRVLALIAVLILIAGCDRQHAAPEATDDAPPLVNAAESGDLTRLDSLLHSAPSVDVRDVCQWTPLMKAALYGHTDIVRHLLDAGAAVDLTDKGGYTALMLAASNDHADVVDLLLRKGADIDHVERTLGWTALIWAAKRGHMQTVQTLLRHGADPSLRDLRGKTALDWANEKQHHEIAALLQQGRQ